MSGKGESREERLRRQLRANLARRKEKARARARPPAPAEPRQEARSDDEPSTDANDRPAGTE